MSNEKALDIREDDPVIDTLAKLMKMPKGKINVRIDNKPALSIDFKGDKVVLDVSDGSIFGMLEGNDNDIGLFDKLKAAKVAAQILDNNNLTFSVLRKGKKAISLGHGASPILSRLITGSNDIQIDSVKQTAKLVRDIQKSEDQE